MIRIGTHSGADRREALRVPRIPGPARLRLFCLCLVSLAVHPGCVRDMLDHICTPVGPGQLVVTELRGSQSGVDTYGQWVELYNASAEPLSLAGLRVRLTRLDGRGENVITVRDPDLHVGPHGYVVLGRFPRDRLPAHVDYGYGDEITASLPSGGIVEVYVCNELVDRVIFRSLPVTGTLSLDGSLIPTVEANDEDENWCNDDADVGGGPSDVGIPGTPGEPNRPCL